MQLQQFIKLLKEQPNAEVKEGKDDQHHTMIQFKIGNVVGYARNVDRSESTYHMNMGWDIGLREEYEDEESGEKKTDSRICATFQEAADIIVGMKKFGSFHVSLLKNAYLLQKKETQKTRDQIQTLLKQLEFAVILEHNCKDQLVKAYSKVKNTISKQKNDEYLKLKEQYGVERASKMIEEKYPEKPRGWILEG